MFKPGEVGINNNPQIFATVDLHLFTSHVTKPSFNFTTSIIFTNTKHYRYVPSLIEMNTSNSLPAQADEDDYKNHQYQQQQRKTDNDSNEFSCVNRILSLCMFISPGYNILICALRLVNP